jgi:hypothetical protein
MVFDFSEDAEQRERLLLLVAKRSLALYLQQTHLYADYSILNAAGHNCLRLRKQIENCAAIPFV